VHAFSFKEAPALIDELTVASGSFTGEGTTEALETIKTGLAAVIQGTA